MVTEGWEKLTPKHRRANTRQRPSSFIDSPDEPAEIEGDAACPTAQRGFFCLPPTAIGFNETLAPVNYISLL